MKDREKHRALLRDLHDLAEVQPDAEATARAIARAGAALSSAETNVSSPRHSKMPRRSICAIAAALVIVAFLTHWLSPSKVTSNFVFGEVQRQVARTKSVQYIETRRDRNPQGKAAPEEVRKIMILGSHLKREEVRITTAGDPLPDGEKWSTGPDNYTMIYNAKSGKMIDLFPDNKGYVVPQSSLGIDLDSGEVHESKIKAAPDAEFYQRIRAVPAEKAQKLPDRQIDGKQAVGFRVVEKVERPASVDTWTREYWVEPESKLPVRIETSFRSTHPRMGETDWVQCDFKFDVPLDENLFSTEPPEGYRDLSAEGK